MTYGGLYLGRTSIMVEYLFKDICFLVVFICCSITLYPFLDRICTCLRWERKDRVAYINELALEQSTGPG